MIEKSAKEIDAWIDAKFPSRSRFERLFVRNCILRHGELTLERMAMRTTLCGDMIAAYLEAQAPE